MKYKNDYLLSVRESTPALIAAHRGSWGGNIVQNTLPACEAALLSGAHILEIDVVQSLDGDFFVFHTGQEPGTLGVQKSLKEMTTAEIEGCRFVNSTQVKISQPINRLDDILEHFKGRCLINIDRSWWFWQDVIQLLKRHNMADQIILKSAPEPEYISALEASGSNLMYLPIVRCEEQLAPLANADLNLIGMELIFCDDSSPLITPRRIEAFHNDGMLLWVNSITLDDSTKLSGGHDDDTSILKSMDDGWGWLLERQFDIIQTDWPALLQQYIVNKANNI